MSSEKWPIPKFHFKVTVGGEEMGFQEVSGLKKTVEVIDYRVGDAVEFFVQKIPGLQKFDNITLKRGVYTDEKQFSEWMKSVKDNLSSHDLGDARKDIVIELLDASQSPVMTWTVIRAFPVSVTYPDLNSTANEIAIESIELAHEGINVDGVD
ncbi:MAG TPA: phage tail protein [Microscillaceae bacterium]|nr:phage tail protein [Microscillaceae bacterium]